MKTPFSSWLGSGGLALVLLTCTSAAVAETRQHDGFYLRLGVGGGYTWGTLATSIIASDSNTHGANGATEVAAGWTIRPGLVLGLGTYPMIVRKPHYSGVSAGRQHVSGTGPFADYYFNPAGGAHIQGALLFAGGYFDGSDQRPSKTAFGHGLMMGVGYDTFVSDEWSLGFVARVTTYRFYGLDKTLRLFSPSLLFAATFN